MEDIFSGNDFSNLCNSLKIQGSIELGGADERACKDFGGLQYSKPLAFIKPTSTVDVATVIKAALKSTSLTVAARGNGHAYKGQSLAEGGIVIDMRSIANEHFKLVNADGLTCVDVSGGALWEDILKRCVSEFGMAPRSWTDYLRLTVGGTLSNAGLSGQAFRYGPQTSNITELEVVTGKGEIVVCNENNNADLFFGVLGGLGQFGIITRARIVLEKAPDMVRHIRLVYTEFEKFSRDAEFLVTHKKSFDYIEGFVFVNNDDSLNGWPTVPIGLIDPTSIPKTANSINYFLEVVLHYSKIDDPSDIDSVVNKFLGQLRFVKELKFERDMSYIEFLSRLDIVEETKKAYGDWYSPHPWLDLLVSKSDMHDLDRVLFKNMLKDGIGGPMLMYPMIRNKWDDRMSLMFPKEEIFYAVILLRYTPPNPDNSLVKKVVDQNEEIVQHCISKGYDFKMYFPDYAREDDWKRHFESKWTKFVELKTKYDPMAILSPNLKIFTRVPQSY